MSFPTKPVTINKTPAPTKKTAETRFGTINSGYGTNGPNNPSSINPGQSCTSALADELKRAGTGDALDQVIAHGAGKRDDILNTFQERVGSDKSAPITFGMKK